MQQLTWNSRHFAWHHVSGLQIYCKLWIALSSFVFMVTGYMEWFCSWTKCNSLLLYEPCDINHPLYHSHMEKGISLFSAVSMSPLTFLTTSSLSGSQGGYTTARVTGSLHATWESLGSKFSGTFPYYQKHFSCLVCPGALHFSAQFPTDFYYLFIKNIIDHTR